ERNGESVFPRRQLFWTEQCSINDLLSLIETDGWVGQQVDFSNNRLGSGALLNLTATLRPLEHLELALTNSVTWLTVRVPHVIGSRVFTAHVERVRATYTFNRNLFIRTISPNQLTALDP